VNSTAPLPVVEFYIPQGGRCPRRGAPDLCSVLRQHCPYPEQPRGV